MTDPISAYVFAMNEINKTRKTRKDTDMINPALLKILSEEDVDEIRKTLKEEIINAIHEEISKYNIIEFDTIQEIFDTELENIREELTAEIDRQIRENIKIAFAGKEIDIQWS